MIIIDTSAVLDCRVKTLERMLVKRLNFISIAIYHEDNLLIVTSAGYCCKV